MFSSNQGNYIEENKINENLINDSMTWEDIYNKIPKLLNLIKQIIRDKLEKYDETISLEKYLKEKTLGINGEEPYIMGENDFENVEFYEYILKCSMYFLRQEKENPIHTFSLVIIKHLIDLCNVLEIILLKTENYQKDDVKYYLYHLISAFSNDKSKLESNYEFLRCGLELLLRNYEITDFKEYYSIKDKDKMRKDFYSLLINIVNEIYQYMKLNNKISCDKFKIIEDIKTNMNKLKDNENENDFVNNIIKYTDDLSDFFANKDNFYSISYLFHYLNRRFPKNINDFYYSVFCCELRKNVDECAEKFNSIYDCDLFKIKFISRKLIESYLIYFFKFRKYSYTLKNLFSGSNSNKIYFQEILNEQYFRKKIIDFYSSNKIKKFIDECCDENEKKKKPILSKLPYLCELLKKNNFWNKIMFFPLSKENVSTMENYLRIVINTDYYKFKRTKENQKKDILELILFELLIKELFNFLIKLKLDGKNSNNEISQQNSNNNNFVKVNDEICEKLIYYFFNTNKIIMVTYEAAMAFKNLSFSNEKDLEKLKDILQKVNENGLSKTAYATFTDFGGIIFAIDDCRGYYC